MITDDPGGSDEITRTLTNERETLEKSELEGDVTTEEGQHYGM